MLFVMLKNDFIIYKGPMNDLHVHAYLPLSSCSGMTISSFAMTLREGGESPGLNVIMMLIVWKCPLSYSLKGGSCLSYYFNKTDRNKISRMQQTMAEVSIILACISPYIRTFYQTMWYKLSHTLTSPSNM